MLQQVGQQSLEGVASNEAVAQDIAVFLIIRNFHLDTELPVTVLVPTGRCSYILNNFFYFIVGKWNLLVMKPSYSNDRKGRLNSS